MFRHAANLKKYILQSPDLHFSVVKFLDLKSTALFHSTDKFLKNSFDNNRMMLVEKRKMLIQQIANYLPEIPLYNDINTSLLMMSEKELQNFFHQLNSHVAEDRKDFFEMVAQNFLATFGGMILGGIAGGLGFLCCFYCCCHTCMAPAVSCGSICGCGACIPVIAAGGRMPADDYKFIRQHLSVIKNDINPLIQKIKILDQKIARAKSQTSKYLTMQKDMPYESEYHFSDGENESKETRRFFNNN